jgi:hypothetical protein
LSAYEDFFKIMRLSAEDLDKAISDVPTQDLESIKRLTEKSLSNMVEQFTADSKQLRAIFEKFGNGGHKIDTAENLMKKALDGATAIMNITQRPEQTEPKPYLQNNERRNEPPKVYVPPPQNNERRNEPPKVYAPPPQMNERRNERPKSYAPRPQMNAPKSRKYEPKPAPVPQYVPMNAPKSRKYEPKPPALDGFEAA